MLVWGPGCHTHLCITHSYKHTKLCNNFFILLCMNMPQLLPSASMQHPYYPNVPNSQLMSVPSTSKCGKIGKCTSKWLQISISFAQKLKNYILTQRKNKISQFLHHSNYFFQQRVTILK